MRAFRGSTGQCARPCQGSALFKWLMAVYALALVASWVVMGWRAPDHSVAPGTSTAEVPRLNALAAPTGSDELARVAYTSHGDPQSDEHLLLLHGSPGSIGDFRRLVEGLSREHHVLVVDMPGFGSSSRHVPDYSVRAHAGYCLRLMDSLGIERVHAVGFSMGGGVALEMADAAPRRVTSVTLLAAIGVIELELLGNHTLNHGLHGLQVAAFRAARWLIPHFGKLDQSFLSYEYARNFYDTDQRRLRPILEELEVPLLILHGEADFLVPIEAAREHARIVPQARLVEFPAPDGHFLPWTERTVGPVTREILSLVASRRDGTAVTRSTASELRREAAARPFDPSELPPFEGPALVAICLALALATFVSEDLACIAAGLLAADGRLSFVAASAACFVGIFVGDMLLYLTGRALGRPALSRRPLNWIVEEEAVERASRWFESRGIAVIFLSRFTPGLRLPTYVAAGVLRTRLSVFALFFAIAAAVWTPALVGIAALAGERLADALGGLGPRQLPWIALFVVCLYEVYRSLPLLFTHRGRRLLRGRWIRRTSWEYWPPWLTYLPVIPWVLWLAVRNGGLSKVTAANPAMPAGGFVGESKSAILLGLDPTAAEIPDFVALRVSDPPEERARAAAAFVEAHAGEAVVLKPDAGQRGSGVAMLEDPSEAAQRARTLDHDAILQERVSGPEFGVFYLREPGQATGRIFSVTEKVLPAVTGDGRRTVEELMLDDSRACALLGTYLAELGERAFEIPSPGESVPLVKVGTHARGAIFLDGSRLITPDLEAAVERIAARYEGFHFGRFDLCAPSREHLARGEDLRVIELNGVTSEATHVYDPAVSLRAAYGALFRQWEIAYAIGQANAAQGAETTSLVGILRAWWSYRGAQRGHDSRSTASKDPHGPPESQVTGGPRKSG